MQIDSLSGGEEPLVAEVDFVGIALVAVAIAVAFATQINLGPNLSHTLLIAKGANVTRSRGGGGGEGLDMGLDRCSDGPRTCC